MNTRITIATALVVFGLATAAAGQVPAVVLKNLQVEYRTTPLGIDVVKPRFSWQMQATRAERGIVQAAYRVEVRDANGGVAWDSKRTDAAESLGIMYAGVPLKAGT